MTGPVFVDTNVLIYAVDQAEPAKHLAAREWRAELWKRRYGRISFQVLQEFYAKVTHKWPKAREQARSEVRDLLAWQPVPIDGGLLEHAWKVQDRFPMSFWDALIVAAAKAAGCQYLLTEDFQEGQDLEGIRILSPFRHQPATFFKP